MKDLRGWKNHCLMKLCSMIQYVFYDLSMECLYDSSEGRFEKILMPHLKKMLIVCLYTIYMQG
jgi:hypothetical protein